ncbi:hypothetical protein F5Y14DRAFT_297332 [Nemania sp. NC0429]|nr:hypothetical protein F5Y14DRAFT_297332 [Nemania sp. NC0429]
MAAVEAEVAEIIRQKKSQYARYIDTKKWSKLEEVALPDAELEFLNPDGSPMTIGSTRLAFTSIHAFAAYFGKFFASAQTLHMIGNGELKRTGPGEVEAIWGMEDQIILYGYAQIRGGGYYHETWVKKGEDWFLKSLRLERTYTTYNLVASIGMMLQRIVS